MRKIWILLSPMILGLMMPVSAMALVIVATDFEGRPGAVRLDIAGEGTRVVTLNVSLIDTIADIRAVYFDFAGATDVTRLEIAGDSVTDWRFSATGEVVNLGGGSSINGIGVTFDAGAELGSSGIGKDDIRATSFTVSNADPIFLGDLFGVRLTSVGEDRSQSLKLIGARDAAVAPVPEPATMLLLGTGLVGLAAASRKKQGQTS